MTSLHQSCEHDGRGKGNQAIHRAALNKTLGRYCRPILPRKSTPGPSAATAEEVLTPAAVRPLRPCPVEARRRPWAGPRAGCPG